MHQFGNIVNLVTESVNKNGIRIANRRVAIYSLFWVLKFDKIMVVITLRKACNFP